MLHHSKQESNWYWHVIRHCKPMLNRFKIVLSLLLAVFSFTTVSGLTAVRSGNWSDASTWQGNKAPSAIITDQDITIPQGITVNLDVDVIFSGEENLLGVDGALGNITTHHLEIRQGTLAGEGTIEIYRLVFSARGNITFTGTLRVNILENQGGTLRLGAVTSIIDTLDL